MSTYSVSFVRSYYLNCYLFHNAKIRNLFELAKLFWRNFYSLTFVSIFFFFRTLLAKVVNRINDSKQCCKWTCKSDNTPYWNHNPYYLNYYFVNQSQCKYTKLIRIDQIILVFFNLYVFDAPNTYKIRLPQSRKT